MQSAARGSIRFLMRSAFTNSDLAHFSAVTRHVQKHALAKKCACPLTFGSVRQVSLGAGLPTPTKPLTGTVSG